MSDHYKELAKRINENLDKQYEAASISFGLNVDSDGFNKDKEVEKLKMQKQALDWAKTSVSEELLRLY